MNLNFNGLSYWERKWLIEDVDFTIVGAGIVGLSTAYHLKQKHPNAKVLVIDKGILPFTASSKNAGFTCFGSPTEILDDLKNTPENEVWQTVEMRWKGLNALKDWLGPNKIDLQNLGSWDLIETSSQAEEIRDQMQELNKALKSITGEAQVYSEDNDSIRQFGFENIHASFKNRLEGQVDTSKLIQRAIQKVNETGIQIVRGITLIDYATNENEVILNTNFGELKTSYLMLCTNGFTPELESKWDLKPARAQVLITHEIEGLKFKGTFHIDRGYYYFRNIGNRLLIGGGRNINFKNEETTDIQTTPEIQTAIINKINEIVLPNTDYKIDHSWAGIMGVGTKKTPIIEQINKRVSVGIRMGGMGVAIGTLVGQKLAGLHDT